MGAAAERQQRVVATDTLNGPPWIIMPDGTIVVAEQPEARDELPAISEGCAKEIEGA